MSLSNPNTVVTEQRLSEFYNGLLPYLGCMPTMVTNKFAKGDLYSTSEKMIGQWIDGKPLYQKTITLDKPTWAGTEYTAVNSSFTSIGASVDKIVDFTNNIIRTNQNDSFKNLYANSDWVNTNTTSIKKCEVFALNNAHGYYPNTIALYVNHSTLCNLDIKCTVQYTKTTDSAISIGSDTDYSTTEKVVGTWISGKPLYQKTFIGSTPSAVNTSGDFATGLSSLNIDEIVVIDGYLVKPESATNNTYRKANTLGWNVWANRTAIRHSISDSGYINLTAYITLQYTKATS